MQIHVSPRNIPLTAAIHQAVAAQIGTLEDLGIDIIGAHVVLVHADAMKPRDRFQARVHLAVPGPDIFAEAAAEDLYMALELVTDKLARQLRKKKTALQDKRRTVSQRAAEGTRTGTGVLRSVRKAQHGPAGTTRSSR
jgi:putative sigma-54 modulation protein